MTDFVRITIETWTGEDGHTYTADALYAGPWPVDEANRTVIHERLTEILKEAR